MNELDPNLAIFQFIGQCLGIYETGALSPDQAALRAVIARRVFAGLAPALDPATQQAPVYPLVTVSEASSRNAIVIGGATGHVNALIDVKITGNAGLGELSPAVTRIKRLLQLKTGQVENVHILGCHLEASRILPPTAAGNVLYHAVVQSFRIRAAAIAN